MLPIFPGLLAYLVYLALVFFSHRSVHLKVLALEHQLAVYK